MKNETQSLFIATTCIGNLVTLDFMKSMLDVLAWVKTKEIPIRFYWHSGSQDIVAKRNTCVAEFLNDSATYSHLLFVDADVAFEVETLEKLLKANKDIAVAPYPCKSIDWMWHKARTTNDPHAKLETAGLTYAVVFENPDPLPDGVAWDDKSIIQPNKEGWLKVKYVAAGMTLIKREVFTSLIRAHIVRDYKTAENIKNMYGFFDVIYESDYRLGEDFSFSQRVQNIGREIWVLCTDTMRHEGPTKFIGSFQEHIKTIELLRKKSNTND